MIISGVCFARISRNSVLSLEVNDEVYLRLKPVDKRGRIFEALRDLFIGLSPNKPLILAVEDLHWIDKTSEEFLSYLIGWLANTRILLILLYRKNNDQAGLAEQYEQMIRLFGFDEDWVMEASKIHLRNGQFDEALNLFTAYLEYDSTSTQIWFSAGAAYEIKNEIDKNELLTFNFVLEQDVIHSRCLAPVQRLSICLANLAIDHIAKCEKPHQSRIICYRKMNNNEPEKIIFRILTNFAGPVETTDTLNSSVHSSGERKILSSFGVIFDQKWSAPNPEESKEGFSASFEITTPSGYLPRS